MYSDSEEEEEGESPLRKSASPRESDQSDSREGEDDMEDVSATTPLAESAEKEDEPGQPTAESVVEIKVFSVLGVEFSLPFSLALSLSLFLY